MLMSAIKPTLALVMIVKNEEMGLERAILSCKNFVDEIIIAVDNSSTDKTNEIAQKYATTLKHFNWADDFSMARNFAQQGVKSDWILFLDGHEFVSHSEKLSEYLESNEQGLLCTLELDTGLQVRSPRIYKNGTQFFGKVHERPVCYSVKFYPEFLIKHGRIGGQSINSQLEREKQHEDMMLRIMTKELREEPRNIRALFHLSLFFQSKGKFKEALKYQNIYFKYAFEKGERWYVYYNRAMLFLSLGKFFRAFCATRRADEETPDRWEIQELRGMIYFAKNKYAKAIESFIESFHINTGDQLFKPRPRNDSVIWNFIGECFFNLGEYYKAYIAFDRSVNLSKDYEFKKLISKRAKLMFQMAKNGNNN